MRARTHAHKETQTIRGVPRGARGEARCVRVARGRLAGNFGAAPLGDVQHHRQAQRLCKRWPGTSTSRCARQRPSGAFYHSLSSRSAGYFCARGPLLGCGRGRGRGSHPTRRQKPATTKQGACSRRKGRGWANTVPRGDTDQPSGKLAVQLAAGLMGLLSHCSSVMRRACCKVAVATCVVNRACVRACVRRHRQRVHMR